MFATRRLVQSSAAATSQWRRLASTTDSFSYITAEVKGRVGVITLNRPKALNALCDALVAEIIVAGKKFDEQNSIKLLLRRNTSTADRYTYTESYYYTPSCHCST